MIGRGSNALTPYKVPCRVDMRVPDCIAAVATTHMMCYQETKKKKNFSWESSRCRTFFRQGKHSTSNGGEEAGIRKKKKKKPK